MVINTQCVYHVYLTIRDPRAAARSTEKLTVISSRRNRYAPNVSLVNRFVNVHLRVHQGLTKVYRAFMTSIVNMREHR